MGEEPERLREAKSKLEYLRFGDGNFTPLDSTDAEALLAEVERLAGERDTLKADRDRADAAAGTNHTRAVEAEMELEEVFQRLDEALTNGAAAEAECERLAGRVAALTEALNDLDRWADEAEYGWYVKAVTETVLANVEGSE